MLKVVRILKILNTEMYVRITNRVYRGIHERLLNKLYSKSSENIKEMQYYLNVYDNNELV